MSDGKEKPEENEDGAASPPPEVDAEVVTEETLAGDDDAGETEKTIETETAETSEESPSAKRKSTLTPGVILFLIFAAAALVIFAVWRVQSGPAVPVPSENAAAMVETPGEAAVEEAPSKIANNIASAGKPTERAGVATGAASLTSALLEGEAKDGAEGGNLGLQQAAKEAFLSAGEAEQDNSSASEDTAPAFEFEPAGDADEAEAVESQLASADLDQPEEGADAVETVAQNDIDTDDFAAGLGANETEASDDVASEIADAGDAVSSSTSNDADASTEQTEELQAKIAALELTLSEERARNVQQREEIGTMRQQFEEALAERDRAASVRIADLAARLDKIENGGTVEASRRAAAALALGAVRRVSDSGEPFTAELDVLAAYVPEGRDMATLRRYANTSVPSVKKLADEFAPAARDAIAAAHRDAAKNPWQKLGARFGNLISVRPAAPVAGDSVEAIISRAEAQVEAGNVGTGVAELKTLPDSAREAMSPWMQQAASRVAVNEAIASLSNPLAPAVR